MWIKAVLLLSVLCLASASNMGRLHSRDHVRNRSSMMTFLNIMERAILNDIRNFTATGYKSPMYEYWSNEINLDSSIGRLEVDELSPEQSFLTCVACRTVVATFIRDRQSGTSAEQLARNAEVICNQITPFGPEVCHGVVELNVEPLVYIMDARPTLTANQICGFVLQGECGTVDPLFAFTVNVNPGNPITGPKTVSAPRAPDELRIIHISDLHYDPHYMVGGLANCINPTCCRRADGPASNPADSAGRWGDFRWCDTPWEAVENTIRQIRAQHPVIDMVYHTGDIVDHGVWETTHQGNIDIMERVYNIMRQVFGNIPVYNSIGNHEAQPTNVFAPATVTRPSLSARWLYDYSADNWQRNGWLSGAPLNTVRQGGYYTVLARPGLRIISLNNNDCYIYNWWIMYSRTEVQAAMQWLHNTLQAAELANERVHILKHLPSGGGSCYKFWSREFRRVIDRFHHIIGGMFNGHSHRDEFEIFYDSPTSQHAVNVAWNGGAATGYVNINPNYHLMYVDRTHYQVQDFESWMYSIPEANQNQATPPRWFRLYSFREAFGLTSTSPAALDAFAFNMARDRRIIRRYWEFKVKMADPRLAEGCNDDCLRSQVCSIVTNEHDEPRRCNQILAVFGQIA